MELPISPSAVIALIFVLGFFAWSVLWEDRREERSMMDVLLENFDQDDEDYINGRHARR